MDGWMDGDDSAADVKVMEGWGRLAIRGPETAAVGGGCQCPEVFLSDASI